MAEPNYYNENPEEPEALEESEEELSFFDKIIALLTEPTTLFEQIRQKPDWIKPLSFFLIFILLSSALTTFFVVLPNLPQIIAEQLERNPDMSPEQKREAYENLQQRMGVIKVTSAISGIISPLLMTIVSILITATFLFVFSNFVSGNSTFLHHFSMVTYASLVGILGILVNVPLTIMKGDPMAQLTTTLATFLPEGKMGTPIFAIFAQINPFTIWSLVLTAIGFAVINKASKTIAFLIVFGLWVVWLGISGLLSGFMQFGM